jgi:hypothetical protein
MLINQFIYLFTSYTDLHTELIALYQKLSVIWVVYVTVEECCLLEYDVFFIAIALMLRIPFWYLY